MTASEGSAEHGLMAYLAGAGGGCPSCALLSDLYPAGYRDPEWDGSEEQFRDVVIPARVKAVEEGLNAAFAALLPEGMRFEWGPKGER